jgi:hypothetical protein
LLQGGVVKEQGSEEELDGIKTREILGLADLGSLCIVLNCLVDVVGTVSPIELNIGSQIPRGDLKGHILFEHKVGIVHGLKHQLGEDALLVRALYVREENLFLYNHVKVTLHSVDLIQVVHVESLHNWGKVVRFIAFKEDLKVCRV